MPNDIGITARQAADRLTFPELDELPPLPLLPAKLANMRAGGTLLGDWYSIANRSRDNVIDSVEKTFGIVKKIMRQFPSAEPDERSKLAQNLSDLKAETDRKLYTFFGQVTDFARHLSDLKDRPDYKDALSTDSRCADFDDAVRPFVESVSDVAQAFVHGSRKVDTKKAVDDLWHATEEAGGNLPQLLLPEARRNSHLPPRELHDIFPEMPHTLPNQRWEEVMTELGKPHVVLGHSVGPSSPSPGQARRRENNNRGEPSGSPGLSRERALARGHSPGRTRGHSPGRN